jgi:hypothetical protein
MITRKMRGEMVSGTYGRHQACHVSPESLKGVDYLKDLGVNKKIILKNEFGIVTSEDVDWTHLAQDSHRRWALVNIEINTVFGFHRRRGFCRVDERPSVSEERLRSM